MGAVIVTVDNIWASRSTLHLRVTVADSGGKWRHKHDVAVPIDSIPEEALAAAWLPAASNRPLELIDDVPLF